jgi:hypothetical protein
MKQVSPQTQEISQKRTGMRRPKTSKRKVQRVHKHRDAASLALPIEQ